MIGTVVTTMARGQITIPKALRDKLGIKKNTLLNVVLKEDNLLVQPLNSLIKSAAGGVIKASVPKKDYIKSLRDFPGGLWGKEDDRVLTTSLKKEMEKRRRSDWQR